MKTPTSVQLNLCFQLNIFLSFNLAIEFIFYLCLLFWLLFFIFWALPLEVVYRPFCDPLTLHPRLEMNQSSSLWKLTHSPMESHLLLNQLKPSYHQCYQREYTSNTTVKSVKWCYSKMKVVGNDGTWSIKWNALKTHRVGGQRLPK